MAIAQSTNTSDVEQTGVNEEAIIDQTGSGTNTSDIFGLGASKRNLPSNFPSIINNGFDLTMEILKRLQFTERFILRTPAF